MLLALIALVLSVYVPMTAKGSPIIKVMNISLSMSWVKLRRGGYMVSGKVPEHLSYADFVCDYLTDLGAEEIKNVLDTERTPPERLPVVSLNAYVRLNKIPHLANPEIYYINPTLGEDFKEIAKELEQKTLEVIEKDPELMSKFRSLVNEFAKNGLAPSQASKEALKYFFNSPKVELRRWLPEEKLPRKLYLYCHRTLYGFDPKTGHVFPGKGRTEVRLYPVELEVIPEGFINIKSVEVMEKDIRVVFTIAYTGKVPKSVPLDLVTVDPPLAKGFSFKGYRYVYVGGYLYYGAETNPNRGSYVVYLGSLEDKFYTFIAHQDAETTYELYIRLGYYGSNEKREEISLWNPYKGDAYYTNTAIDMSYTHKKFLKLLGVEKSLRFTFKIVSPQGYESKPFVVTIK